MTEFIGYHGTDNLSANSIVSTQTFHPSIKEDEWLSKGVYFYWDMDDAHWWCTCVKSLTRYTVLIAKINGNEIVDLVHNRKDQLQFKQFCDMVAKKCDRLSNGRKRSNYMSLAINIMIKNKPPDIIIGSFDQNRKFWFASKEMKDKFPLVTGQIQICVLNLSCISDVSVFKEVG